MKNKMIGILIFILLLATSLSASGAVNIRITSCIREKEQSIVSNKNVVNLFEQESNYDFANLDYCRIYHYRTLFKLEDSSNLGSNEKSDILSYSRNDYTPHSPISINRDSDFTEANGVTGGNGTSENPYIIEGWEISSGNPAINIGFTTSYFIIRNCFVSGGQDAVIFYEIERGAVDSIIISGIAGIGFYIERSSNITITNSNVSASVCIKLFDSSHHLSISNCMFTASSEIVYISDSSFIELTNLTTKNGFAGMAIFLTNNITIIGCEASSNVYGIVLVACENGILRNNTMNSNTYNFEIAGGFDTFDIDTSNTINGKPIYYLHNINDSVFDGNENYGFFALINCQNVTVKNFVTNGNSQGIILAGTTRSTITSSTFNDGGYLYESRNNFVDHCSFNGQGLWMDYSPQNTLRNNTVLGGDFSVWGLEINDFYQDVGLTNTRNGKPIYYLVEQDNKFFNGLDCGYLGLVNCNNFRLSNIDLNNNWEGLLLVNSSGTVGQCSFSSDVYGIEIAYSTSKLTISRCTFNGNEDGFHIIQSSNIIVKRCNVKISGFYGMYLENSSNNIIRWCTINNAVAGIRSVGSSNNQINFNTFASSNNEAVGIWYGGSGNDISFNTILLCGQGVRLMYGSYKNNVHHNTMKLSDFWGIEMQESDDNNITYNDIRSSKTFGVRIGESIGNVVDHNNIVSNDQGAVIVDCTADISNNWWGSSSGPSGIGPGSGDSIEIVNATVYYEPWLKSPVNVKLNGLLYILTHILN
jgi:parallel beta-helix repeat protein